VLVTAISDIIKLGMWLPRLLVNRSLFSDSLPLNKEADYVLALKGNQETLHEDVSLFLDNEVITKDKETLREKGLYERTIEKGHDRIETRECFIWPET